MSDIVVIGAGIAGLATAALAAQDGHDVTVLERRDQVGGRAGTHEEAGFLFDTGPSWYLMPEVFDAFFRRFGTSAAQELDLIDLPVSYRLFPGHRHSDAAPDPGPGPDTVSAARADPPSAAHADAFPSPLDIVPDREALRALAESLEPGSSAALDDHLDGASRLYDLAVAHALRTDFGREHRGPTGLAGRVRSLGGLGGGVLAAAGRDPQTRAVLPQLPGLLTGSLRDHVHARFRHPLLRQILLYPSVFLATDPQRTPALYHLMSRMDLIDGVQYPRGGFGTLIDVFARLARNAGVRIRTGTDVLSLRPGPRHGRRRDRSIAEIVARTADGILTLDPDWVVAACDLHHVETRMLPPALVSAPARVWEKRDPGMGALTILLGVEGRVPGLQHHNLFFTDDWEANFASVFGGRAAGPPEPASTYVCAPSVTDAGVAPDGCENLFILVPFPANPSLRAGQAELEAYADRVIDSVGARVGVPDLRERTRVRRVQAPGDFAHAFHAWSGTALGPAHTLGQSAMFRDSVVSPRVPNLLRAGAFTAPGVGLPMCVMSAENAIDALRVLEGA